MYICKFCSQERKNHNSLRNHERFCHENADREYSFFSTEEYKTHRKLNKTNGHLKATREGKIYEVSEETKEKIRKSATGRNHTEETRKKLSDVAKARCLGGHTSKVRLHFQKKDGTVVYLQSSYEIRFAEILEELCIAWSRPSPLFWVDTEGSKHRYYADFKIKDLYVDTKNDYLILKDSIKIQSVIEQNSVNLIVLSDKQINKDYIASLV